MKGGAEIRRRRFKPALVWAAAWLAVERGDITERHALVATALEYCAIASLREGMERYAAEARQHCEQRLIEIGAAG